MQTHWICGACAVEWVPFFVRKIDYTTTDLNGISRPEGATWTAADGCPKCGHQSIRLETYEPAFPGADIPRERMSTPIVPTPIVVPEKVNQTLRLSTTASKKRSKRHGTRRVQRRER